jgi:hypothetical protein
MGSGKHKDWDVKAILDGIAAWNTRAALRPPEPSPQDAELKRLRGIIERERSRVADLVTRMEASLAQRQWLLEGRGNYAWDDDGYRKEFAAAVGDVRHVIAVFKPMARDLSDCPVTADEVAKARAPTPSPDDAAVLT